MTNLKGYIPVILDNLIWVLLLGVIIIFSFLTRSFLTLGTFSNILYHASVLGIMVIGQTFTLVTGNFDLSTESTLGLAAFIGAWLILPATSPSYGSGLLLNPILAIIIMLLLGLVIGWVNGNLITRLKMNNFIVTLAMLIALRGLVLIINTGYPVFGTPALFNWLGSGKIGPIPVPVIVVIVAFIIAHIVLQDTPFGRELYAVGSNRDAALASGVNPQKRIRQVYIISGVLAAFAGWMLAGQLTAVTTDLGLNMIFEVFAAAVIGGISLNGGRGTMLGALGGVLLLSTISAGLNLVNVSPFWLDPIRGFVILVAMLINAQKVRYVSPAISVQKKKTVKAHSSVPG